MVSLTYLETGVNAMADILLSCGCNQGVDHESPCGRVTEDRCFRCGRPICENCNQLRAEGYRCMSCRDAAVMDGLEFRGPRYEVGQHVIDRQGFTGVIQYVKLFQVGNSYKYQRAFVRLDKVGSMEAASEYFAPVVS